MDDSTPITPVGIDPREGLDDPALRTAFGFDRSDDAWLDLVRESKSTLSMGRLGPYRLLGELGRGGQGSVYRAHRDGDEHPVALKRMPILGASIDAAARFEREREAISLLSHPCIVGIRRVEVIDGQSVLAMELVEGAPIDQWAGALPGRPIEPILEVFLKVCDAVAHAHRRGVLHRDLKPSNILVDARGGPRVLDFGLAKLTDPSEPRTAGAVAAAGGRGHADSFVTRASGFVGTPAYAAPEQLAGDQRAVDTRCDVYSLGVLLYALLTGTLPLDAKAALPVLFDQIRSGISRPPSSFRSALGRELDAIALKAVAVEPSRRYASVDDFAADLRRYLAGQTVLAHPPTTIYKLSKIWKRHRFIAPIMALAGVGVVALSVVSTSLALSLREQRDRLSEVSSSELLARQAAEKALEESQKQTERHKAAAGFLSDMLAEVHESYLGGQPRGSREMIDHAARRLDAGELANQPDVEVSLLYAVGRAYYDLGFPRDAERFVLLALEKSRAVLGPEHLETGRCLYMVGLLSEGKEQRQQALEEYTRAREIVAKTTGEEDLVVAQIDNNRACVLRALGRVEESEQLHRRTLATRVKLRGGEHHSDVVSSLRNLAISLSKLDRFEEAHQVIRRAITLSEQTFGAKNEKTIIARMYLSRIQIDQGRHEEALKLRLELLALTAEAYGPGHSLVASLQRGVYTCYNALGRWAEGVESARAARESYRRIEGSESAVPDLGCSIAEALRKLGRFDEAIKETETTRRDAESLPIRDDALLARIERLHRRIADEAGGRPALPATAEDPPSPVRPSSPASPDPDPSLPPSPPPTMPAPAAAPADAP